MRDLRGITFCSSINLKQPVVVLVLFLTYKLRNALPDFVHTTEFTGFKLENQRPHFEDPLFFLITIFKNYVFSYVFVHAMYFSGKCNVLKTLPLVVILKFEMK